MHNQYPSDKILSTVFDPSTPLPNSFPTSAPPPPPAVVQMDELFNRSPSPTIPSTPAPAYTALPNKDTDFHFAPILEGKIGEIELETIDGKRFLVHKKILEQETVFFHIYYGYVPVWRLSQAQAQARTSTSSSNPPSVSQRISTSNGFTNLRYLPKIIANTISRNSVSLTSNETTTTSSASSTCSSSSLSADSDQDQIMDEDERPPPVPPKDHVIAPTPTSSPYVWVVPESSYVLMAFLSLIYPPGIIARDPDDDLLNSLEITSKVIRASLGYQSFKALNKSRNQLSKFIKENPIDVYALSCFFKFEDLIKLSSIECLKIPFKFWSEESKLLMGKSNQKILIKLQELRLNGLKTILSKNRLLEIDNHLLNCENKYKLGEKWNQITETISDIITPDSDLLELLEIDLSNEDIGNCPKCLNSLGKNTQRCLIQARELPRSL
ncbi:uncharacterized protein L201_004827 [Kwoniella dendrophila CBS 6074]|uniref:BTB domain-containing protein n=1 Tax=Kwoniella dendrophila CBS 6074 TaxID=1295534 RepID=A0AAX4JYF2_9TREE